MAEIITEPEKTHVIHHVKEVNDDNNSGSWMALAGITLLIVIALLFFYYALPLLNRASSTSQISVPDEVNVNLNSGQQ